VEKSAGAIIFRKEGSRTLFLLLHYPVRSLKAKKEYWDFPKGHIEKGETIEDTVKREVQEETGLTDIKLKEGFQVKIKYYLTTKEGEKVLKTVIFLLAETKTKDIKISEEHVDFIWLPYEEALKKLIFKNARNILGKASEFLLKRPA